MATAAPTFFTPVFSLHRGARELLLAPTNRQARERLCTFGEGTRLRATLTVPRSLKHNALYWVILGAALEATGDERSTEDMHFRMKVAFARKCRPDLMEVVEVYGQPFPRISTAFDKMDQQEWAQFFDFAMPLIRNNIMGGMTDAGWAAFTSHASREGA